uniref:NADH-ubiquinone oxidoreductase chain 4L n=1 Tax=Necydalis ulmi TaxID=294797 RepID=U3L086_9CUCU|nr:NADH dehydrogenase subunit 4L [Necydalis ulmi]
MLMYTFLFSVMYFCGLVVFCLKRKHLLLMLLSLEYIILSLYLLLFIYFSFMLYEYFFYIFLTMSVCEGALGLSILVLMIRTNGNDYILTFTSLW